MRNLDAVARCAVIPPCVLLAVLVGACAASKDAPPAESPAATGAAQEGSPALAGQTASPPDTPTIQSPFEELDKAEKELLRAIDERPTVAEGLSTADRCTTVCRALASMRRSAEQICTLDASRCTDARARVTRAEDRAKSACPACSTPT